MAIRKFDTGAVRDNAEDKPLFSILPQFALLDHAYYLTEAAKKYGKANYRYGMPLEELLESQARHHEEYQRLMYFDGEIDLKIEHLNGVIFNAAVALEQYVTGQEYL